MKKLNKTEAYALAEKIANEITTEKEKEPKEYNAKLIAQYEASPEYAAWHGLSENVNTEYHVRETAKILRNKWFESRGLKLKDVYFTKQTEDIMRELIIAQIECDDLDALIQKVKAVFLP